MSILFVMIPLSLALVLLAGWAFFWAVGSGQFDDLESPGWDVLREEGGNDQGVGDSQKSDPRQSVSGETGIDDSD